MPRRRPRSAPAFIAALAAALALSAACSSPGPGDGAARAAARSLAEVYAAEYALAAKYPGLASTSILGYAASASHPEGDPGLPLLALELRGSAPAGSPAAQLVGAMHGDEEIGAELALAIAESLCAAYADPGAAVKLLASIDLTVLPVANPWGYEAGIRENWRGVNLNRNFDWAWAYGAEAGRGLGAMSELESAALAADARNKRYALSVSLHSGAYCISLPWDYLKTDAGLYSALNGGAWDPDWPAFTNAEYLSQYAPAQTLFQERGDAYVSIVGSATDAFGYSFSPTQGADWYVVCGSFGDWLYGRLGCPCYTVELSTLKDWQALSSSLGAAVLDAHEAALLDLLASAGRGARGRVMDAFGAYAGDATVTAIRAAPPSGSRDVAPPKAYVAFALSDAEGYFRLALPAGSWSLTASLGGVGSVPVTVEVGTDGYSAPATLRVP